MSERTWLSGPRYSVCFLHVREDLAFWPPVFCVCPSCQRGPGSLAPGILYVSFMSERTWLSGPRYSVCVLHVREDLAFWPPVFCMCPSCQRGPGFLAPGIL